MDVAAKADDITEAEAVEEFEQFNVAEAAIGQDRHRHALGQDRLQTGQAEVFEVVALVLQFVLVDRQPQERRRPAVAGDEAQSQRRLIVGVEIGPVHRHDDRHARAHDLANPRREKLPHDDSGVAQQAVNLFDRVFVRKTARLRQRMPDQRNGQRRSRQNPQRPIGQRQNPLGVQAPRKRALQKIMNQSHPLDRLAHACFCPARFATSSCAGIQISGVFESDQNEGIREPQVSEVIDLTHYMEWLADIGRVPELCRGL
jgi:hypothetical protein